MYKIIDLPYAFDALEPHIDAKTMEIHHDRHHQAYATNLNGLVEKHPAFFEGKSIEEVLTNINEVPEDIRQGVINNGGGLANHDLFWTVLGANMGGQPTGELASKINEKFGSFENFKTLLSTTTVGRFGAGWGWLVVNANNELEVLATLNQDSPLMDGKTPIFGIDVWEHAYYLNYQNRRPDYVNAIFNVVNWAEVARRYEEAVKKNAVSSVA
ncbi:MAG: superoxide dismutase [Turicibacter sp.]|nr:superoxide dismutase [Turicibacter sp.]